MNYKGGRCINSNGYIRILKPDHPFAEHDGYVLEHRLIYEHYLKIVFDEDIFIPPQIEIDHDNEIKTDNSLINLNCFTRSEHKSKHTQIDYTNVFCLFCNKKTYVNPKGKEVWYQYEDSYICRKCYIKNGKTTYT